MKLEEKYLMMVYVGEYASKEALIEEIKKAKALCKRKNKVIPDSIHVHTGTSFGLTRHGKTKIFTDNITLSGHLVLYEIVK